MAAGMAGSLAEMGCSSVVMWVASLVDEWAVVRADGLVVSLAAQWVF